mgnify:CR=1 FL=1
MPEPLAEPLFPTYTELKNINLNEYPELTELLNKEPDWFKKNWAWGQEFLVYIGRNKSEHTFSRFRNEVERFLLWTFLIKEKPMDELRKSDILEYADFCWQPPLNWICLASYEKFIPQAGLYTINKKWAPFRLKLAKGDKTTKPDKSKYRPSQQTLTASFTAVIAFYKYLMNEEYCYGNPAQIAKKDCRYFIKDVQVKEIKRLTTAQWQYVLDVAVELADSDPNHERTLFLIAALKTLFLRISELSERPGWSPTMNHFWEDDDGNWWLKIYGKGRKIRDVTVPIRFIEFLNRYRFSRGLSDLPSQGDTNPIIEKIRGRGGMTSRQLSRIVQTVFDLAYERMKHKEGENKARKLKEASAHWLRHTGASVEIERGRALKDLSEDLGHSSMATTDTVYVHSEDKKRAASGKERKVN